MQTPTPPNKPDRSCGRKATLNQSILTGVVIGEDEAVRRPHRFDVSAKLI